MISIADLDRIRSLMAEYGLDELTLREGRTQVGLKLRRAERSASNAAISETVVHTQAIGEFLLTHPRRKEPQVSVGDQVAESSIVGFLRSGPVLLPVRSGVSGQVMRIDAKAGSLLGFGAPVLTVQSRV